MSGGNATTSYAAHIEDFHQAMLFGQSDVDSVKHDLNFTRNTVLDALTGNLNLQWESLHNPYSIVRTSSDYLWPPAAKHPLLTSEDWDDTPKGPKAAIKHLGDLAWGAGSSENVHMTPDVMYNLATALANREASPDGVLLKELTTDNLAADIAVIVQDAIKQIDPEATQGQHVVDKIRSAIEANLPNLHDLLRDKTRNMLDVIFEAAQSKVNATLSDMTNAPEDEAADDAIDAIVNDVISDTDTMLQTALNKALNMVTDDLAALLSSQRNAFDSTTQNELLQSEGRLAAAAASVGAHFSSAFMVSMAMLEHERAREVYKFTKEQQMKIIDAVMQLAPSYAGAVTNPRLEYYKERVRAKLQRYLELLRSYLSMYASALSHEAQVAQVVASITQDALKMVFGAEEDMYVKSKLVNVEAFNRLSLAFLEVARQYVQGKFQRLATYAQIVDNYNRYTIEAQGEYLSRRANQNILEYKWPFERLQLAGNLLASPAGAVLPPAKETTKAQVAMGALSGAASGFAMGGPLGAVIGAGTGILKEQAAGGM